MSIDIDQVVSSYPCRNCGKEFGKTFGWLKSHGHVVCECGALNKWSPDEIDDGIRRFTETRDEAIAKVRRALKSR